jgi:hypothetical protein
MNQEFEDDLFLAPESTVWLNFVPGSDGNSEDWAIDRSDVLAQAERAAWSRHATRPTAFGNGPAALDTDNGDQPMTLREAIRLVMQLP